RDAIGDRWVARTFGVARYTLGSAPASLIVRLDDLHAVSAARRNEGNAGSHRAAAGNQYQIFHRPRALRRLRANSLTRGKASLAAALVDVPRRLALHAITRRRSRAAGRHRHRAVLRARIARIRGGVRDDSRRSHRL